MYPARVVKCRRFGRWSSPFNTAWYKWAILQRWGILKWNKSVSSAAACPVMVLRQVRNGVSSCQFSSNGMYPCIMADTPIAPTFVSGS